MENQETQAEVVVEEQATTATATPAVEAALAPEAAPAKKKKLNVGKGILVLVFFFLSLVAVNFFGWQSLMKIPYIVGMIVWFVGYCITAEKVGKIVRTVGVGLMAIYWLTGLVENIALLGSEELKGDEDELLAYTLVLIRGLVAFAMVAVLGLTDWLPKARNLMNTLGNVLMPVLIIANLAAIIFVCMYVYRFAFIDVIGFTFLALALKIAKSAVIEARE